MDTFVLGIGTGRCGTQSLATILGRQRGASVTHERFGARVRWGAAWRTYPLALYLKAQQACEASGTWMAGDVASYWLPQVRRFAGRCRTDGVTCRVVCLQRLRDEVIASFERKVGAGVDHWRYRPSEATAWSWCFPTHAADSRAEAIGLYWDAYYEQVSALEGDVDIYRMKTADLSDEAAIADMLAWCGVESPNAKPAHQNRTRS